MATTVTRTVGPGLDYETLSAALADTTGEARDLVTADEIARFECHNFEDTTAATFGANWTTDATRYIEIVAVDDHGGSWSTDTYRLHVTEGNGISVPALVVKIRGIQIMVTQTTSSSSWRRGIQDTADGADIEVDRCIIRGNVSGSTGGRIAGVISQNAASVFVVANCIIYDWLGATNDVGVGIRVATGTPSGGIHCYNNTLVANGTGLEGAGTDGASVVAKNNIGSDNLTADYAGLFNETDSTNNLSSDATAPGTNPITGATVTFEDEANDIFLLDPADASGAITGGVDLSADADFAFDYDILNVTRTDWDIGAHEVSAAAGDTQLLTVDSVVHVGNWTDDAGSSVAADLATAIGGETANDATFAQSEESPSISPLVFKFTNGSPPADASQTPRIVPFRIRKDAAGGDQIDFTLELREGYTDEASPGTLIATASFANQDEIVAQAEIEMTQTEVESITDWTALYGRVVANVGP